MSYVRLNIIDQKQTISGEVHGYYGDALVASLTAEPDTVEELALALERFIKSSNDAEPFFGFRKVENLEPHDAGILVIDLASRIVAAESTYSQPSPEGSFRVQSEFAEEDIYLPYKLSDDWLFINSIPAYEGARVARRNASLETEAFPARKVLYGEPLLRFIATECLAARDGDEDGLFTRIHAKWLTTKRSDLGGKAPRDVLLEKHDFIDLELQSRSLQWSFAKVCPPPLPASSRAYRFSGFGTHEIVVYYDLIRYLLANSFEHANAAASIEAEIERLQEQLDDWLSTPNEEFDGKAPGFIVECERRRLNIVMSAHEAIIDEDCEICQAMAEDFDLPMFWHLDGSNMDEGFEFSFERTREQFDQKEREREEWCRQLDEDFRPGRYDKAVGKSLDDADGRTLL